MSNPTSRQSTPIGSEEEDFAPPPVNWADYRYTPLVGHRVARPGWKDKWVDVTSVSYLGLFGIWSRTGKSAFFARHPGGLHIRWIKVGDA